MLLFSLSRWLPFFAFTAGSAGSASVYWLIVFVVAAGFTNGSASVSCYSFHVHKFFLAICLDDSCHFVFRLMLCFLFVCLVQVFAYNVVASLYVLYVCWAAARDLNCKCIYVSSF